MQGTGGTKKLHIECLRALCIWLVMFTHTSTAGFSLYLAQPDSAFFPAYLAVPFWVKTAVPIFFMISGALLLGKDEPIAVVFKKRIWRFVQILLLFSVINYIFFYRHDALTIPEHLARFFTITYTGQMATAYYFIYIYIAFLLLLPIWRTLVRHMTNRLFLYLAGLQIFFVGFIPVLSFFIFKGTAEINWFLNPVLVVSEPTFYFLIGYWMENVLPDEWLTRRNLTLLGIAAILGTLCAASLTCWRGSLMGGLSEGNSERFYYSFLFLNTAFIYCSVKKYFLTHTVSGGVSRLLVFLGSMSFGVMLFEEITRSLTRPVFNRVLLAYFPQIPFIDAVIWISGAFVLGLIFTWLFKKIPYFGKLI